MSSPGCFHPLFVHLAHRYDQFDSKLVIPLDDLVIHSLFGQRTPKTLRRKHSIQNIGLNFQEDMELLNLIYTGFEKEKHQLEPSNPTQYISVVKSLALALHRGNSLIKRLNAARVLDW